MQLLTDRFDTAPGPVCLVVRDGALCALGFEDRMAKTLQDVARRFPGERVAPARDPAGMTARLEAYFAGDLRAIEGLSLDLGGTPFQRAVWAALCRIPCGETRSYAQLARAIEAPSAVRAVASANAKNPVSIVVPCHRVIASDGTLCGYGGGVERKRWLLTHERAWPAGAQRSIPYPSTVPGGGADQRGCR